MEDLIPVIIDGLTVFAIGAVGAGCYAMSGYFLARADNAKTPFEWKRFLGMAVLGGVAFFLVDYLGLDVQTVMELLAAAGLGAGGMKVVQTGVLLSNAGIAKLKKK